MCSNNLDEIADEHEEPGYYDTMQVCLNGHQITEVYDDFPETRSKHCKECGKKTIHQCQHCNEKIRGHYHVLGAIDNRPIYATPSNCHKCGKPYPWKSKLAKMDSDNISEKN